VTSSSLRSSSSITSGSGRKLGGATRLSSSTGAATSTTGSTSAKKSKLGGLGAVKKSAPVDFAEAERRAQEEAERIKQLGYDRQREEEEEKERKEAEKAKAATEIGHAAKIPTAKAVTPVAKQNGSNADVERLGMGFQRLGFGAIPTTSSATTSPSMSRSRYVSMY
jgi:ADP-ribosylation factor GTPase-activating protein 2/3